MGIQTWCGLISTLLLCFPPTGAMAVENLPRQYLIFGGNGMLGSATVERLLASGTEGDSIVVVNRGNWYWNTALTVRPFVRHIKCDRSSKLENCPELISWVAKAPYIDTVIDFSAYRVTSITDALELVEGKAKLYVYISSDSVYEVCNKNHTDFSREEDAVRPTSEAEREKLNHQDHYGHQKLACEEALRHYRKENNGPPYIALRLPDVVGPRDNTYRWWVYQLWIKLQDYVEKAVSIPASISSTKLSFVYANDVADLLAKVVKHTPQTALDEAFNLAVAETPTLLQMLDQMKEELNLNQTDESKFKIVVDENSESIRLYPSVRRGAVDISKAQRVLHWKPSEWSTVVKETVRFYESAIKEPRLTHQKETAVHTIQTHFTSKPHDVIRGLKTVYGLSFAERKDEL